MYRGPAEILPEHLKSTISIQNRNIHKIPVNNQLQYNNII